MTKEFVAEVNAMPGWVSEMGIMILTATAEEVTCEWEVWIRDEQEQLVAQGRVRLLCADETRALG